MPSLLCAPWYTRLYPEILPCNFDRLPCEHPYKVFHQPRGWLRWQQAKPCLGVGVRHKG